MTDTGKSKYSGKISSSNTLSTKNPTRPYLGEIPGLRDEKPATGGLSYRTSRSILGTL